MNYLLGQANGAYLVEDYDKAISSFLEVIRLDPYVPAAWVTLSSCYKELGDEEKARQMRFLGAHVDDEEIFGENWRKNSGEYYPGPAAINLMEAERLGIWSKVSTA